MMMMITNINKVNCLDENKFLTVNNYTTTVTTTTKKKKNLKIDLNRHK
jgi:hypothetical protein